MTSVHIFTQSYSISIIQLSATVLHVTQLHPSRYPKPRITSLKTPHRSAYLRHQYEWILHKMYKIWQSNDLKDIIETIINSMRPTTVTRCIDDHSICCASSVSQYEKPCASKKRCWVIKSITTNKINEQKKC